MCMGFRGILFLESKTSKHGLSDWIAAAWPLPFMAWDVQRVFDFQCTLWVFLPWGFDMGTVSLERFFRGLQCTYDSHDIYPDAGMKIQPSGQPCYFSLLPSTDLWCTLEPLAP